MTDGVAHNPNVQAVPVVLAELGSLAVATNRLRTSMESLGGLKGNGLDRAVTLRDLVTLGLVTETTIRAVLKGS